VRQATRIAPSILSADFARLGEEARAITAAGADYLHIDVMDGHFVPNITIGPAVVKALRPHSNLPFDVHLMISPVDLFLHDFAAAGADTMTVHPEAGPHLHRTLQLIKSLGKRAGVALNPASPVALIENVLDIVDLVLVMSVNPGFGGQEFLPLAIDKIAHLVELREEMGLNFRIEVDGGIAHDTVALVVEAGADMLVAGSAIFAPGKTEENAREFLKLARAASPAQIGREV